MTWTKNEILNYMYSFIMSIYIAPLHGDYSEALPIPVRTKGQFLDEMYNYEVMLSIFIF